MLSINKKISLMAAVVIIVAVSANYWIRGNIMTNIKQTDPEFAALWQNFVENDVEPHGKLDKNMRMAVKMVAHIGMNGKENYRNLIKDALKQDVDPIIIKEALYQTIPYAGYAKAYDFLLITNEEMQKAGIKLPLEGQSNTTVENRLQKGLETQREIFGKDNIDSMRSNAPDELKHIQDYLSANCFGDYYTRSGLDIKQRELITFSVLVAMGGAEPQAKAHATANQNVGNDKQMLLDAVTEMLPYIGYPRSLNAIAVINEIYKGE